MPGSTAEGPSSLHHCGHWEEPASVLPSSPGGSGSQGCPVTSEERQGGQMCLQEGSGAAFTWPAGVFLVKSLAPWKAWCKKVDFSHPMAGF